MAEWIARGEPETTCGKMDIRRFGAHYRSPHYTLERAREVYETYYDIQLPRRRAPGRPAAARLAGVRVARASTARCSARSRAGSASTGTTRTRRRATRRCARAAGRGMHWSPAIGAEHARLPRARRAVRRVVVRQDRGERPGRGRRSSSGCATTASRARSGAITYTQMLNARGGIECDFTVTRLAEDRSRIVTGTAFGSHDLGWIRAPRAGARRAGARTSRRAGRASACGGRARATSWRALTPDDLELPVHALRRARGRRRAGARAAGHLRRRARLGAVLPDGVRRARCGARCGRPGEPHGLVAGGYRAIDSLRLEKGYRVWGADITPDETPYEAGLGFCVRADKDFIGKRGARRPSRRAAPVLPHAGGPALGGAGQRAGARRRARSPAASRAAATATRSGARSPTPTCRPSTRRRAPRWPSRSSASGSTARSPPSRSWIPRAPESASGPLVTCS